MKQTAAHPHHKRLLVGIAAAVACLPTVAHADPPSDPDLLATRQTTTDPVFDGVQPPPEHSADDPADDSADDESGPELRATDVLAQTGSAVTKWPRPTLRPRFMSPKGVNDPFIDKPEKIRPRDAGILLSAGLGLAAGSVALSRLTLLPDCDDQNDVTTCLVPDGADIGVRSGRLFGTIALSVGGAAFGAFGARELGRLLQQGSPADLPAKKKLAVGLGAASVAVGVTGLVVGATMLGVGARRSVGMAAEFDTSIDSMSAAEIARLEETVDQVKVARGGLMVLTAAPFFVASGISLLVHRPREPRVRVAPIATKTTFGLTARVRF